MSRFVLLRQKLCFFVAKESSVCWRRLRHLYQIRSLAKLRNVFEPVPGLTDMCARFFASHSTPYSQAQKFYPQHL